jgi:plasmid stability protein
VARARKRSPFDRSNLDRLNVRLPEPLRRRLAIEARSHGHSLNVEIVRRLRDSFLTQDNPTRLIAEVLLDHLDGAITEELVDIWMKRDAEDMLADDARKEEQIERGLREEGERE